MDFGRMGADAAKGAAMGSVVPGVGTALGAAGGVVVSMAPEIGQWLFGPRAGETVQAVQEAVATVTGTSHPDAQVAALSDPNTAMSLRLQLSAIAASRAAQERQGEQAMLVAQLADVANARATTVQLAQAGSPMAWGAAVISIVVLVTFGAAMALTLLHTIPANAEPLLNVLLGSLTAMATSVVSYWVGSSVGSYRKDTGLLAQQSGRNAQVS